jgi:hypothetical protein
MMFSCIYDLRNMGGLFYSLWIRICFFNFVIQKNWWFFQKNHYCDHLQFGNIMLYKAPYFGNFGWSPCLNWSTSKLNLQPSYQVQWGALPSIKGRIMAQYCVIGKQNWHLLYGLILSVPNIKVKCVKIQQ